MYRFVKRIADLVVAGAGLLLLAPVLGLLALLVRIRMGAPVIFRQQRPGRGGIPFVLFKLRSMTDDRDENGELLPGPERLTRFGRFLRQSSLDELPELWNVLRGDMSLVGPRPLLMEYLPLYNERQSRRHEVRPGITGWAQVNGRNTISWEQKFEYDIWYVDNVNPLLDLRIIVMTAWQVVARRGISAEGHATMPRFEGKG